MLKSLLMIGLLSMSTVALLGTEANARVCLLSQGGSCIFWSGSVECDLTATGVGDIKHDPKSLGCNINSTGTGLLLCGNPGAHHNAAPGIQVVTVPESFGSTTAIKNVDKNGKASATVITSPDLTSLNSFCPNTNWVALDYVPCTPSIDAALLDQDGTLDSATYSCTLPSCETLGYDPNTLKFERRQYECTRQ